MPGTDTQTNSSHTTGPMLNREQITELRSLLPALLESRPIRQRFLKELMAGSRAKGGIFWELANGSGGIDSAVVRADVVLGLNEMGLMGDRELAQTCQRMAIQTLAGGTPALLHPASHPNLPVQFSLLVIPVLKGRRPVAVLQLFIDSVDAGLAEAELRSLASQFQSIPETVAPATNGTPQRPTTATVPPSRPVEMVSAPPVKTTNPHSSAAKIPQNGSTVQPSTAQPPTVQTPVVQPLTINTTPQAAPPVPASAPPEQSEGWTPFLLELHRTLRLDHMALTAVNDGRQLLGCDRLTLAINRSRKLEITAISGVDRVNRRSDEIRSLLRVAKEAVRGGEPLQFSGDADAVPPQLERPLADYLAQSHSRMVQLIPLKCPDTSIRGVDEEPTRSKRPPRILGCLIAESFSDQPDLGPKTLVAEELARHVSIALNNALTVKKVPAIALWRIWGSAAEWLHGRKLMKLLAIVSCLALVILAMAFVPYEYRITAEGKLVPIHRQRVFAPWDGDVVGILVESGQTVTAGTPLIRLENEELRQQLLAAENELAEHRQRELALQAEITTVHRDGQDDQETRLRGELAETRERVIGLAERVGILRSRYDKLLVRAPVDGVVVTFQLDQLLQHRPVARGDELLEIMLDDGSWELEVQVPDHRMGHLLQHLSQSGEQGARVEFILQTATEKSFYGQLVRSDLATRSIVNQDGQAVVEARIVVDEAILPTRRIGAEVTAKVDCGKMNLGYVLFGDVLEFLQRTLWL